MLVKVFNNNKRGSYVAELEINGIGVCLFGHGKTEETAINDLKKWVNQFISDLQAIDYNKPGYVDECGEPIVVDYKVERRLKARSYKPVAQIYKSDEGAVAHLDTSRSISIGLYGLGKTEEIAKRYLREKMDELIQAIQRIDYNNVIYVDGEGNLLGDKILKLQKEE